MQVVCSARLQASARANERASSAPVLRAPALHRREILFAAGGAALLPAAPALALAEVGDVAPAFELPSTVRVALSASAHPLRCHRAQATLLTPSAEGAAD